MANKVAYLADNLGGVEPAWKQTIPEVLLNTGGNVGNLAFWHAARLLFDADEVQLVSRDTRPDAVASSVEVFVIPAANFLHAGADLTRMAALVRKLNRPTLVVGLGAQAESETAPPTLKPGTLDFLGEVSRLSPSICVRGPFTQDFCRTLGTENTTVLGCPSLLINPDLKLGEKLEARIAALADTPGPLAIHAACIKAPLENVERELVRLVQLHAGSSYVVQRPVELMKPIFGEPLTGETEVAYFKRCVDFLGFPDGDALSRFLRAHGDVPASINDWVHGLRRYVAGINTRIHGTMMGIAAGLPSVCIAHDTRTRELSQVMRVPHIAPREFLERRFSVPAIFAAAKFSGSAFDTGRGEKAAGFAEAVRAVGLTPSRHLLRFLDA